MSKNWPQNNKVSRNVKLFKNHNTSMFRELVSKGGLEISMTCCTSTNRNNQLMTDTVIVN